MIQNNPSLFLKADDKYRKRNWPLFSRLTLSVVWILFLANFYSFALHSNEAIRELNLIIEEAQENDPWLKGNEFLQKSKVADSISVGTLPDPRVGLSYANIPLNSFDTQQEPMTQLMVTLSQMLPRGDSRSIQQQKLTLESERFPIQRALRKSIVKVLVANIWFDIFQTENSIRLIENDRYLFEQLIDVAQASYSSAVGKTRQHDIIRAQLELTRLDDRLIDLKQRNEFYQQKLSEWVHRPNKIMSSEFAAQSNKERNNKVSSSGRESHSEILVSILESLPDIQLIRDDLIALEISPDQNTLLLKLLNEHPAILEIEQRILIHKKNTELAKQKYKPEWGISATYGYRDDDLMGNSRSDLFSIGVSFDLPIFTSDRQDQDVASTVYQTESVRMEKWQLLREFIATFKALKVKHLRLNERQRVYQNQLLPQMTQQAEASLTAYTNNDGDFSEVVRSRIAQLNAQIDALVINVEKQKNTVQLNYFLDKEKSMIKENGNPKTSHLFNGNKNNFQGGTL